MSTFCVSFLLCQFILHQSTFASNLKDYVFFPIIKWDFIQTEQAQSEKKAYKHICENADFYATMILGVDKSMIANDLEINFVRPWTLKASAIR